MVDGIALGIDDGIRDEDALGILIDSNWVYHLEYQKVQRMIAYLVLIMDHLKESYLVLLMVLHLVHMMVSEM